MKIKLENINQALNLINDKLEFVKITLQSRNNYLALDLMHRNERWGFGVIITLESGLTKKECYLYLKGLSNSHDLKHYELKYNDTMEMKANN